MPPLVCLVMSRMAWCTVSGWLAHSWSSRSPCSQAGSRKSLGNGCISVSFRGLLLARPYRSANRLDPTDTVMVSPSAGTVGPSTSLSEGGCPTPRSGGVPPVARNQARPVSSYMSSARSGLFATVQSKAATEANGCLSRGPGVSTPAWWGPWNGYAVSVAGPLPLAWSASARAPPASTPPASAVPAAPDSVPLRKLRRLTFTRGRSLGGSSGVVEASVGRGNLKEIGNGGERLEHRVDGRIHLLARRRGGGGERLPLAVDPGREQRSLQDAQLAVGDGRQAGLAGIDQRGQVAQHGAGDVHVGVRLRECRAAALVVNPGQVITQRVLEDFVRPNRQVGGVAGQVVGGQVLPQHRDVAGQRRRDRQQDRGALAVPQAVLQPVQPGEVLVVDSSGEAVRQAVDGQAELAEAVVGSADALPVQLRREPVLPRRGRVTAAQVSLDPGDRWGQVGELLCRVGLVLLIRAGEFADGHRLDGDRAAASRGGGRRVPGGGHLDRLGLGYRQAAHEALEDIGAAGQRGAELCARPRADGLDLGHDVAGGVVEVDLTRQPGLVVDRERLGSGGGGSPVLCPPGPAHSHSHDGGRCGGCGWKHCDRHAGGEGRDHGKYPGYRPRPASGQSLPLARGARGDSAWHRGAMIG